MSGGYKPWSDEAAKDQDLETIRELQAKLAAAEARCEDLYDKLIAAEQRLSAATARCEELSSRLKLSDGALESMSTLHDLAEEARVKAEQREDATRKRCERLEALYRECRHSLRCKINSLSRMSLQEWNNETEAAIAAAKEAK